jgi:hypothetical protein
MNEINFDDLEDKAEWDGSTVDNSLPVEAVAIPGFVEDCPKCRGTGTWRPGYRCFKCKGTGKLQFKTSPDQRAKGRKSAAKSKAKKDVDNKLAFWSGLTSSQAEWLKTNVEANSFAASLITAGEKYGHLTEGQSAAVYKAIARDDDAVNGFAAWVKDHEGVLEWLESEQAAGNEFAARLISAGNKWGSLTDGQLNCVLKNIDEGKGTNDKASAIDLSGLMKGFYAVPDGDTRLKIAVRRPGKKSRWFGWTFVDDGAAYGSRKTYGKQAPDGTYSGAIQDQLRTVLADPKAAMIAYGKLTGTCGVCGRILEDEVSVANGIGPICAEKF